MIDLNTINKIYIVPGATDLRLGIDGYSIIVQLSFNMNPLDGSLYLFCNKNHNKIKILHFEENGFWLYYKRIETGTLKWPKTSKEITNINPKQLRWLLEGLKINQKSLPDCKAKRVI